MYCRDYCAMLNNGCSVTNFHNVHANHTGYVWWQTFETRGHCFIPLQVCTARNGYLSAVHCDKNFCLEWCEIVLLTCRPNPRFADYVDFVISWIYKVHCWQECSAFSLFILQRERTPLRNKLNCCYVTPYQSQRHAWAATKSQQCLTGW